MSIISFQAAEIVRLKAEVERWRTQALTDFLTGLDNRYVIVEAMSELLAAKEHFLIFVIDLNLFKEINDRVGHEAGDRTLQAIANSLRRTTDLVYRLGGDEFAVIAKCEADEGKAIASRLKHAVRSANLSDFLPETMASHRCGAAIGWASSSEFLHYKAGLELADGRMYADKKRSGQRRFVLS